MKYPILMYHEIDGRDRYSVTRQTFERHMRFLSLNRFRTIVPGETPRLLPGERPVMITFDDGYRSDASLALPVMEHWGLRPVSFVTVDYIGRPGYLTWNDVRTLSEAGGSVQSHTCSHPLLTTLPPAEVRREARDSRIILEQATGRPVNSLSFPGGGANSAVCRLVREEGYRYLFTSRPSLGGKSISGRVLITENISESAFSALVKGERGLYFKRAMAYDSKVFLRQIIGPERYLNFWRRHLKYRGSPRP